MALADYANLAQGEKLNIMGIFDNIFCQQFPCRHMQMVLVLRIIASAAEFGRTSRFEVRLIDEDAIYELVKIEGEITIGRPPFGNVGYVNQVFTLTNVEFPKAGDYEFSIFIDNVLKGSLPIRVIELPQANV